MEIKRRQEAAARLQKKRSDAATRIQVSQTPKRWTTRVLAAKGPGEMADWLPLCSWLLGVWSLQRWYRRCQAWRALFRRFRQQKQRMEKGKAAKHKEDMARRIQVRRTYQPGRQHLLGRESPCSKQVVARPRSSSPTATIQLEELES